MEHNQNVIEILNRQFAPNELKQRPGGGGAMLDYIEWTTAVRRLDEAFGGPENWDFKVSDPTHIQMGQGSGYLICSAELAARFPGGEVAVKSGFGGAVYGQGQGGRGLNPDDAAKAAGSDALKKCAQMLGVALYLAEKDGPSGGYGNGGGGYNGGYNGGNGGGNGGGYPSAPQQPQGGNGQRNLSQNFTEGQDGFDNLFCEECEQQLTPTSFKDGTSWAPGQLAVFGRRKHNRVLCMTHYREANQAKRRAEESLQQVPF